MLVSDSWDTIIDSISLYVPNVTHDLWYTFIDVKDQIKSSSLQIEMFKEHKRIENDDYRKWKCPRNTKVWMQLPNVDCFSSRTAGAYNSKIDLKTSLLLKFSYTLFLALNTSTFPGLI